MNQRASSHVVELEVTAAGFGRCLIDGVSAPATGVTITAEVGKPTSVDLRYVMGAGVHVESDSVAVVAVLNAAAGVVIGRGATLREAVAEVLEALPEGSTIHAEVGT